MSLYKLVGAGLPNVYLNGGVHVTGDGDTEAVSYENLDGLYSAIARALGLCAGSMPAAELRFLRKRLGLSQKQLAELGDKSEQAAAKWEKGTLPVPKAEASLVRLAALNKFGSKRDIAHAVARLGRDASTVDCTIFVFSFDGVNWNQDDQLAQEFANDQFRPEAVAAIKAAILTSATFVG